MYELVVVIEDVSESLDYIQNDRGINFVGIQKARANSEDQDRIDFLIVAMLPQADHVHGIAGGAQDNARSNMFSSTGSAGKLSLRMLA